MNTSSKITSSNDNAPYFPIAEQNSNESRSEISTNHEIKVINWSDRLSALVEVIGIVAGIIFSSGLVFCFYPNLGDHASNRFAEFWSGSSQDTTNILVLNNKIDSQIKNDIIPENSIQEEEVTLDSSNESVQLQSLSVDSDSPLQRQLVSSWVEKFKNDFVAHAVWGDNFAKVIESGAILPGEAVLRSSGTVEYEEGRMYGQRGTKKKIQLSEEMAKSLEVLDPKDEEKLNELLELDKKEKTQISEEELKELKQLKNQMKPTTLEGKDKLQSSQSFMNNRNEKAVAVREEIKNIYENLAKEKKAKLVEFVINDLSDENYDEYLNLLKDLKIDIDERGAFRLNEFIFAVEFPKHQLTEVGQRRFEELSKKIILTDDQRKEIKALTRKKYGLPFLFKVVTVYPTNFTRKEAIKKLMEQNSCPLVDINIAYDEYKEKQLDRYLAHKFNQWTRKGTSQEKANGTLTDLREMTLQNGKLNCQIRAMRNGINWEYGNIVVARGEGSNIMLGEVSDREVSLLAPWQNEGNFFTLPLQEPNTIVIGKKNALEKYSESLKNMGVGFAYIENLTPEQKSLFSYKERLI